MWLFHLHKIFNAYLCFICAVSLCSTKNKVFLSGAEFSWAAFLVETEVPIFENVEKFRHHIKYMFKCN